jgi:predicted nucleic acid-binding protein
MDGRAIFIDTNVLLTATTPARPLHSKALEVLNDWPSRGPRLCTSGQVLREYLVVATRPPEVNGLGLSPSEAIENVVAFRGRVALLEEGESVARRLAALVAQLDCRGKQIHDANVVATALVHGVPRLLTANVGDFRRFEASLEIVDLGGNALDATSALADSADGQDG